MLSQDNAGVPRHRGCTWTLEPIWRHGAKQFGGRGPSKKHASVCLKASYMYKLQGLAFEGPSSLTTPPPRVGKLLREGHDAVHGFNNTTPYITRNMGRQLTTSSRNLGSRTFFGEQCVMPGCNVVAEQFCSIAVV